ncbi:DNA binding protein [Mycobacterium phage Mask]|nr:DNA binding protein [Mycobacterium phage Sejanus]UVT31538.1 DNA binding protein [Mycobacterium phage Mask]
MTAPQRWEPDEQMVAAVLSMPKASRKMTELSDADRAWLVAGLTLAGVTAQDIADRLGCSLRLVRSIRAEDITQMAYIAQQETLKLGDELRSERCLHAVTRRELADARAEVERLRAQVDQLVDAHMTGELRVFPKCGHPMVPYNTYEHGGRRWCRECARLRKQEKRKRRAVVVV